MSPVPAPVDPAQAVQRIRELARAHGFQRCGIAGIELGEDEAHLADWLGQGLYGTMDWMARHGTLRARPAELLPGITYRVKVEHSRGEHGIAQHQSSRDETDQNSPPTCDAVRRWR